MISLGGDAVLAAAYAVGIAPEINDEIDAECLGGIDKLSYAGAAADASRDICRINRTCVLVVDLNSNIDNVRGDGSRLAFGQIVCTADAFDEVQAVRFEVEGQPRAAPKGDGESTDEPLTCTSYANLFPDANG